MNKTQGEIESAICDEMNRYERKYMGRGPRDIRSHLFDDFLLVRLCGVLTAAEQHLVSAFEPETGRDLLKRVRNHLRETARPTLEVIVEKATGVKVVSLHHDISTQTGEEVICFSLASAPVVREKSQR